MITSSLTMVVFILIAGFFCTLVGRRHRIRLTIDDDNQFRDDWWSKKEISYLFLSGIIGTFIFLNLCWGVIHLTASHNLNNASVVDTVLTKMDYKVEYKSENKETFYNKVATWLMFENDSGTQPIDAAYSNDEPNIKRLRERFIASYFVDADTKYLTDNPRGMLYDVAIEKNHPIEDCANGMGVLLGLWLKSTTIDPYQWLKKEKISCIDGMIPDSKGIEEAKGLRSCLTTVEKHIRGKLIPGWTVAAQSTVGLDDFKPESSYMIAANVPETESCAGFHEQVTNNLYQNILVAQVENLKYSLTGDYRMGIIVFGPIQFVLLSLFFAACVGLGERRGFGLAEDGLIGFSEARAKYIKVHNPSISDRAIKQLILEELNEEASFPFDFASYALGVIGFIGTVIGIASALAGSGEVVAAASRGLAAQQEAIASVTGMLGIAFDTTLIALATGVFVYFSHEYCKAKERSKIREIKL